MVFDGFTEFMVTLQKLVLKAQHFGVSRKLISGANYCREQFLRFFSLVKAWRRKSFLIS